MINRKSGIRDFSNYGTFCLYFYLFVIFFRCTWCVLLLAKEEKISTDLISDLRFMIKANPVVAWCMVLFMLSMAGIPPTIGFILSLQFLNQW